MASTPTTLICTQCGHVGKPKQKNRGNGFIELILWLSFIVPGIIYSIWRRSTPLQMCTECKNQTLIPVDSPLAKKLMSDSGQNQEEYIEQAKIERRKNYVADRNKKVFWVVLFTLLVVTLVWATSQS